jgi:nicotinamidase-related amidase
MSEKPPVAPTANEKAVELKKDIADTDAALAELRATEVDSEKVPSKPADPLEKLAKADKADLEKRFKGSGLSLDKVTGLETLSYGEGLLVLEMLQNEQLKQIKETAQREFEAKNSGFFKSAFRRGFKDYYIAKEEKKTHADFGKKGLEANRIASVVEQVRGLQKAGVTVDAKEGKYTVNFVKNEGEANKTAVEAFNKVATEFSKIPDEWGAEYATKGEKEKYKAAYEKYNAARAALASAYEKTGSKTAVQDTVVADAYTKLIRFTMANPQASGELKKIGETKAWKRILGNTAAEKGLYVAIGAGARMATAGFLGIWAAPLVAAGLGAHRAGKREREAKRQRDIRMRNQEGLNTKSRALSKDEKEKFEQKKELAREKAFVSAEVLAKRLDHLYDKVSNEPDPIKRAKLVNDLKNRIDYSKGKLEAGYVSLGGKGKHAGNQVAMIAALAKADAFFATANNEEFTAALEEYNETEKTHQNEMKQTTMAEFKSAIAAKETELATAKGEDTQKIKAEIEKTKNSMALYEKRENDFKKRLNERMENRKESVALVRKADRDIAMIKGAAIGAGAAIAGRLAVEYIHDWWSGDNDVIGGGDTRTGSGGTNHIEQPEPVKPATEFVEAKVGVSSRGSIQTFVDLKKELALKYPAGTPMPPAVKHILETDATSLSKEVGYFRANDVAESHMAHAGDEYRINKDGDLVFFDKSKGQEFVIIDSRADGNSYAQWHKETEMFDSDGRRAARVAQESANPGGEKSLDLVSEKPAGSENVAEEVNNLRRSGDPEIMSPAGNGNGPRILSPNGAPNSSAFRSSPESYFSGNESNPFKPGTPDYYIWEQTHNYPIVNEDPVKYGNGPKIMSPGTPAPEEIMRYQGRMRNFIDELPTRERQRVLDMNAREWGDYQRSMDRSWGGRAWRNATWGMGKFFKWLFTPTGQGGGYYGGNGNLPPITQNGTGPGVNQTVGQWLNIE